MTDAAAARRRACGVPATLTCTTKPQLGLAMIEAVLAAGARPFQWVTGADACGDHPALLDAIDRRPPWDCMAGAHATRVGRTRPAPAPAPWSGRGRTPSTPRLAPAAALPGSVADLAASLPAHAWQRATIQEGRQGPQAAALACLRVVAVRDGLPGPEVWLVLRRALTDGALKTYLSNAPADIAHTRRIRTSGMRWPIETCCEVGKQAVGMGDDAVRSWRGWHHPMTLIILALACLVRLQGRFEKTLRA